MRCVNKDAVRILYSSEKFNLSEPVPTTEFEWRFAGPDALLGLTNAQLTNLCDRTAKTGVFANLDVLKVNFRKVNFRKVNFRKVNFRKVNFRKVNFRKVNFRKVNFRKVNFRKVNFRKVNFRKLDKTLQEAENSAWRAEIVVGRYVLVDFGNMIKLSDVFSRRNVYLRATYPYNPPEYKLFAGKTKNDITKNY
ncbi:hypothetical protein TSOC_007121 [Tetrabaena socialis]|uniref:Pentapeptide repeat-containing protein n=1 Tax=Tetrabaena socialis TaxID=47790 RepID=A0A2J8A1Q3_9CHLO|nr:hypothetical protein TSOC_007121 [Tetrabaena socialis]|eukprot:PNH06459.1 hypothetical protein TSOC_007121 [Tetrabaena socialis]